MGTQGGARGARSWRSLLRAGVLLSALAGPAFAQPATTLTAAGMEAYNRGDHERAYALLRRAAGAGDAEALANLGYLYTRGHGVPPDSEAGLRLYRQAAAGGSSEGMNAIGHRHDHGSGVTRDPAEAVRWYCAALALGNPRALNNLGIMVAFGRGVPVDQPEAARLWEQAAALGHANAMLNLGVLHLRSAGSERDRARAVDWLEQAAQLGQAGAQSLLRRLGHAGLFPGPVDHGTLMRATPWNATGHSRLCGTLIARGPARDIDPPWSTSADHRPGVAPLEHHPRGRPTRAPPSPPSHQGFAHRGAG